MKKLKLYEEFVNELKLTDDSITSEINKFHALQLEIERMQEELKKKKKEFAEFDNAIQPIIESMKETDDKLAETEGYVVKIIKFGYETERPSYKNAFELALTKVNRSTQKILEEALEATKNTSKTAAKYTIDRTNEGKIMDAIKSVFNKIVDKFKKVFSRESKNIDKANNDLKKLAK